MRNINKIVLLIFSIIIFSCSNNGKPSPRAIHLNDKAMEILMENGDMSEEQIDEGLRLLDEATTIEPDYQLAYWNKMSFLFKKKDYNRLLETNQEVQRLMKEPEPYLLVQKGMIYEIKGDSSKSKLLYKKGIALYDSIISVDTSKGFDYKVLYLDVLTMANQGERAKKEFEKLKIKFPEKEFIEHFELRSKEKLLEEITNY